MQPLIENGVKAAMDKVFTLASLNLDQFSFTFQRTNDINLGAGIFPDQLVPAMKVNFRSARGTHFSVRTTVHYYVSGNETKKAFLDGAGFRFSVKAERDAEGYLIKKTCHAEAVFGALDAAQTEVVNDDLKVVAPVTDYLWSGSSPVPFESLILNEPMPLVE